MKQLLGCIIAALLVVAMGSDANAQSVSVGGMKYTLLAVHRSATLPSELSYESPYRASGEYITIYLEVRNTGNEGADVSGADFKLQLHDNANVTYDEDTRAEDSFQRTGTFFLTKINPGLSKRGHIVFDVPANTSPSRYDLQVFGNHSADSQTIHLH